MIAPTEPRPLSLTRRLFILLFWSAAAFALVMASLPQPPAIPGDPQDKLLHVLAFVVLTGMWVGAYPATHPLAILLGLGLFGGLIELIQAAPVVNRDASVADWLADILAVLAVLVLVAIARRLRGQGAA